MSVPADLCYLRDSRFLSWILTLFPGHGNCREANGVGKAREAPSIHEGEGRQNPDLVAYIPHAHLAIVGSILVHLGSNLQANQLS